MIAIANDHAGIEMKLLICHLLEEMNFSYKDFGTNCTGSCDYPKMAYLAAKSVASGECELGIVICGTGIGVSLAANKVKGIRCALLSDCFSAKMARQHNNANMLAIGSRVTGPELAKEIVRTFLNAEFEGGRHQRRIDLISQIEEKQEL